MFQNVVFIAFLATWFLLGVISLFLFYEGTDVALKRRWWPRMTIFAGVLFVAFSTAEMLPDWSFRERPGLLLFEVPVVALITYLNIKTTEFCGQCASQVRRFRRAGSSRACPKCGAKLDAKADPIVDDLG